MVEKIYDIKNKALQRMEQAIAERGVDRMDVKEMGELADIVKDLAEAEKSCMEADYYNAVTEAMDGSSGYMPEGMGYDAQGGSQGRSGGGRSGYRDSMGRYARGRRGYQYGYDHDPLQDVRQAMSTAAPEERERMQRELRQMLGM